MASESCVWKLKGKFYLMYTFIIILWHSKSFDFSCMAEIEDDNVYNKILRRTIMKTLEVDRGV